MNAQRLQNRTSSSTPPGSGVSGGEHGRSTGPACPSPRPPALARLPAVLVASLTLCGLGVADTPLRDEAMDEVTAGQFSLDFVLTSQLTQPFLRGGSFLPDYRERLDRVLPPTSVELPAEPRVPAMPVTPPAGQAPEPSPPAPDTPAKPVPTGGIGVTAVATATGTTFSSSSASSFSGPGGSGGSAKAVACCGSGANVSTGGSAVGGDGPGAAPPPAVITSKPWTAPDGTVSQTSTIGKGALPSEPPLSEPPVFQPGTAIHFGQTSLSRSSQTSFSLTYTFGG